MAADMLSSKKLQAIVTKLLIILIFSTQSYLTVLKKIRLNYFNYFVMKIPNKKELQQIALNLTLKTL